ncbi:MAG: (deoxy)nucleoside triphosphate pyrophosphohydrolase [Steroidobacteraceae bacterium]|nr:(deoxy)nucleoside triphosphate pyrophosphohydrolase [Steroidobacteraceae bacterium]
MLRVVAGALFDEDGRVLIAERPAGRSLAGRWEFPGGKVGQAESDFAALRRELREELGIELLASEELGSLLHDYGDRSVELHCHCVLHWTGTPRALDGQRLRWVALSELHNAGLLEADRPFVEALQRRGAPAPRRRTIAAARPENTR